LRNIEQDVLRTRIDVLAATKTSVQMMIRVLFILARELAREESERSQQVSQSQSPPPPPQQQKTQPEQSRSASAESFTTSRKLPNPKSASTSSFSSSNTATNNNNSNASSVATANIVQYYQQGMSEMLSVLWYVLDNESIDQSRSPTHDGFVDALSQAHIESDCFHLVRSAICRLSR
jgi:hypothetical protein